ncbi:hypothetical protein RND71_026158 [Anisodus tanguticus]|uniref:Uncharacterized protein n=1 Tax=Anisodus tanguticus TaxID=243964 RepID=A0AAE1VA73_9SOLA|nr:hypothetical protein RND71_026158 [Anisodus tanguticus]
MSLDGENERLPISQMLHEPYSTLRHFVVLRGKISLERGPNCCVNSSRIDIFLEHEPQTTTTKNMVHIAQSMKDLTTEQPTIDLDESLDTLMIKDNNTKEQQNACQGLFSTMHNDIVDGTKTIVQHVEMIYTGQSCLKYRVPSLDPANQSAYIDMIYYGRRGTQESVDPGQFGHEE